MRIEDSPEYIDHVAQAVVDRLDERARMAALVEQVAHRVMELQQARAEQARAEAEQARAEAEGIEEGTHNAGA